MRSVEDIALDLQVTADNFLAINSTEEDNKDWYGKMFVDAEVDISGTALRPVVDVDATTSQQSEVTYVYRLIGQGLVETEGIMQFVVAGPQPPGHPAGGHHRNRHRRHGPHA